MKNNLTIHSIFTYSTLFLIAFFYCFGIESLKDGDMYQYFINGFYMTNYGMEGIKGYPNQLFSLFLYWGYKLTGNWYGLSNILFLPLYLFGVYSLHQLLNYFIKQKYISLLFSLLLLINTKGSISALNTSIYTVYFFLFISTIYLSIYHPTKLYLIGFYLAVGSLFRNQLVIFIPFIPFIINPKINKKEFFQSILKLLLVLALVHFCFETAKKTLLLPEAKNNVSFSYYFTELYTFLLKNSLFRLDGLIFFLKYNSRHVYCYLVLMPCFFMFNKKFANSNPHKPLLKVFLILSLFIYFMPAIMYLKIGLFSSIKYYFPLLSRYSFIMIPLLLPVYHFILKEQTFIKLKDSLKNKLIYIAMVILLLPILRIKKVPIFIENTFNNISYKKEIYAIDSVKVESVIKENFKETDFFVSNNPITKIYVGYKNNFQSHSKYKTKFNFNQIDGIILINENYPSITINKNKYMKIYEENSDKTISIYKKIE